MREHHQFIETFCVVTCLATAGLEMACSDGILDTGADTERHTIITDTTSETSADNDSTTGESSDSSTSDDESSDQADTADAGIETEIDCLGGYRYRDICWYLGLPNQNCIEACDDKGAYFDGTPSIIGTPIQGGSQEHCNAILPELVDDELYVGEVDLVEFGTGIGCYRWIGPMGSVGLFYATNPLFDPTHKSFWAERVCGCGNILD